jgi:hypothetical protein
MCYVSSTLSYQIAKINNDTLDIIAIDSGNYRLIGLYKPFKLPVGITNKIYFNSIIDCLSSLTSTNRQLVIGGDFNVNLAKTSWELDQLDNWSINAGLSQMVDKTNVTRVRIVSIDGNVRLESSAIDHVYTNVSKATLSFESSISDHLHL